MKYLLESQYGTFRMQKSKAFTAESVLCRFMQTEAKTNIKSKLI